MASVVGDIGLRFQEGVQDLKIGQQLAPTRDAISKTLVTSSTNFLKVVGGVRGRLMSRTPSVGGPATPPESGRGTPVDLSKDSDTVSIKSTASTKDPPVVEETPSPSQQTISPQVVAPEFAQRATKTLSVWGSGIGSFFSSKASKLSLGGGTVTTPASVSTAATSTAAHKPNELDNIPEQVVSEQVVPEHIVPRDLDAEREQAKREQAEREQAEKELTEKGQAEEQTEKEKLAVGQQQT